MLFLKIQSFVLFDELELSGKLGQLAQDNGVVFDGILQAGVEIRRAIYPLTKEHFSKQNIRYTKWLRFARLNGNAPLPKFQTRQKEIG